MKILRRIKYYSKSAWKILRNFKQSPIVLFSMLSRANDRKRTIQLINPQLLFVVRGAMDVWSVKETLIDEFYIKYSVPIQEGWTIVDIGAGIGDFSIYAAYSHPKTTIYAFEPFSGSFELLTENLDLNDVKNVNAYPIALWSSDGELLLENVGGEPLQIASKKSNVVEEPGSKYSVQAKTLHTFLVENGIEKVDLIKMDCEGAEYDILIKAHPSPLDRIDRIIMEYHDLDSDRNHQRMTQFLEGRGYRTKKYKNQVHDEIGYLYAEKR